MKNKKLLFLFLIGVIAFPLMAFAVNEPTVIFDKARELVVNIGIAIVVIGWIIAGILYLTAAGSPEKTGIAKKAMIAAIIGTILVVIAAAGYEVIKQLLKPILGI